MRDFILPYIFMQFELGGEECLELSGIVLLYKHEFLNMSAPRLEEIPESEVERLDDFQDDDTPVFLRMIIYISLESIKIDSVGDEKFSGFGIDDVKTDRNDITLIP